MFLLTSSQRKALHTHTQIQSSTPDNCKGNWFVTIATLNVQLPCCQPASDQHQQPKYTSSSADCAACLGPSCQKSNVSVYKAPILTKCFMRYNHSVVKANELYFKYFAFFVSTINFFGISIGPLINLKKNQTYYSRKVRNTAI